MVQIGKYFFANWLKMSLWKKYQCLFNIQKHHRFSSSFEELQMFFFKLPLRLCLYFFVKCVGFLWKYHSEMKFIGKTVSVKINRRTLASVNYHYTLQV